MRLPRSRLPGKEPDGDHPHFLESSNFVSPRLISRWSNELESMCLPPSSPFCDLPHSLLVHTSHTCYNVTDENCDHYKKRKNTWTSTWWSGQKPRRISPHL